MIQEKGEKSQNKFSFYKYIISQWKVLNEINSVFNEIIGWLNDAGKSKTI